MIAWSLLPEQPDEKEQNRLKGPLSGPFMVLNRGMDTNLTAKSLKSEFRDAMGEKINVPSLPRYTGSSSAVCS
jgi:hypothetical protein